MLLVRRDDELLVKIFEDHVGAGDPITSDCGEAAMQFSIRSILMLTAICTLAFYAVYQTGQIKEIQGSVIELRLSLIHI